ncbi:MAG: cytochrome c peroxidase [Saprospiraceae bacterium]
MMKQQVYFFLFFGAFLLMYSCERDIKGDLSHISFDPKAYVLELPGHFPPMPIPADNPMTEKGVELGRFLFYDPILSIDSTISCASCHDPSLAFTDGRSASLGVDGKRGKRNSMSLINIGFTKNGFFWDGRAVSLEDQALKPVEDPLEMNNTWSNVVHDLKIHPRYPQMFREAFGINSKEEITKELAVKAIAQFERILISQDSKYDLVQKGLAQFNDFELFGQKMFFDDDPDIKDAECSHCHNAPMATSDDYFNNGMQYADNLNSFADLGRGVVTMAPFDNGKMKAPTLRNIFFTGPYMHDGSLATFDEVLGHYSSGGESSPNRDPLMNDMAKRNFTAFELMCLKAFIKTFEDTEFNTNPKYQSPY